MVGWVGGVVGRSDGKGNGSVGSLNRKINNLAEFISYVNHVTV